MESKDIIMFTVWIASLCMLSTAQLPSPCDAPTQFVARVSQYNPGSDSIKRFTMQYDAVNERVALFEDFDVSTPQRRIYQIIILAKENVEYLYKSNQHSKECTKAPARSWRQLGIPHNGTFEREFTLGAPREMFVAQQWSDRMSLKTNVLVEVTGINCFLIKEFRFSSDEVKETTITDFYDVRQGMTNLNDFIPPKECITTKNVQDESLTDWP